MNSGEDNSDPIPIDLIIEILLRLPAKSIARFRCVSKLWSSILHRQYFKELFLTRSRARPRLLFALKSLQGEWSLFSSPQPQPQKSSSLVVSADVHTNFPRDNMCISGSGRFSYCYASGLIYFSGRYEVTVICHPSTGEYAILPTLMTRYGTSHSLLGFDPIDKQFKVLSIATPSWDNDKFESFDHNVQTLGTGNMRWRKIQCPLPHYPLSDGTCINGVLYYIADDDDVVDDMIVCFDVRSEKFKFIRFRDYITKLINYKGKLGVIWLDYDDPDAIELHIWVLEDAEKQEWSKYVYTLPENKALRNFSIVGVIATGEIVLSMDYTSTHFYVFYFNPERNTLQTVEIQGLDEKHSRVCVFLDHVEDLNANDAKILKSSISAPSVNNKRSRQSSCTTSTNH